MPNIKRGLYISLDKWIPWYWIHQQWIHLQWIMLINPPCTLGFFLTKIGQSTKGVIGLDQGLGSLAPSGQAVGSLLRSPWLAKPAGKRIWTWLQLDSSLYTLYTYSPPHWPIFQRCGQWIAKVLLGIQSKENYSLAIKSIIRALFMIRTIRRRWEDNSELILSTLTQCFVKRLSQSLLQYINRHWSKVT